MSEVEIYTTPICPYCISAKALLANKGIKFTEIDVMITLGMRQQMIKRANGNRKVPQIFIDGKHIGGCDELQALDACGDLDALLCGEGE